MATRFRLPSTGAPVINPPLQTYTHTGTTRRTLPTSTVGDASALTTTAITPDAADHIAAGDQFHAQFVSAALSAQTIASGLTVKLAIQGLEADAGNNLFVQLWIGIYNDVASILRATLLAKTADATELNTTLQNRILTATTTAGHTLTGNELLVVEISVTGTPTATGGVQGHNASLRFGSNGAGGDLPENDTEAGTTFNPWFELGADLLFQTGLRQSITTYWKLDETSGTRAATVGIGSLTDVNTVGAATGRVGNAAAFVATNSEYFTVGDHAEVSAADIDFTVACWAYFDTVPATTMRLLAKIGGTSNEWSLHKRGTGTFAFFLYPAGVFAETALTASTSTWYFIVAWHDATANTINIQVNNGTVASTAHTTGMTDSDSPLTQGAAGATEFLNGRLDEVGIWKRVLTAPERTQLYNGGAGLTYPFLPTQTQPPRTLHQFRQRVASR